jgi:hypothetical protein
MIRTEELEASFASSTTAFVHDPADRQDPNKVQSVQEAELLALRRQLAAEPKEERFLFVLSTRMLDYIRKKAGRDGTVAGVLREFILNDMTK